MFVKDTFILYLRRVAVAAADLSSSIYSEHFQYIHKYEYTHMVYLVQGIVTRRCD